MPNFPNICMQRQPYPGNPRQPIPGYDRDDHLGARLAVCLALPWSLIDAGFAHTGRGRAMTRDQILVLVRDATSIYLGK